MKAVITLLKKELLLEVRQQYSFYGILLYIGATVFVLFLAISEPEKEIWNGLFWIIQLFVCINAVAKSFMQESRARMLYYYTICSPVHFILAKLLFNALLMLVMTALSLILFFALLGNPVQQTGNFLLIALLGSFSLSMVFSFLAAIAAKARQNAAIMAVLGFPLIVPQLMLLMKLSAAAFQPQGVLLVTDLLLLLALDFLVGLLAVILFPFLWRD
ncbi:hypothetical protein GCM10027051_27120 [Niabella terrae]